MKLIFIHGSGGCGEAWHHQTNAFENADAVNLPGHPEGELLRSIEGYADWLKAYITDQGYSELVLVGHSMGGGIALQYALTYPDDLKAIVTIGSGGRLRVHPKFLDHLEKSIQEPAKYEAAMLPMFEHIDPQLKRVISDRTLENGPEAGFNDMRACDHFDIMDRLGEIRVPVLALCGDADNMTPPKYSQFMAEKIPDCRVEIIPGGSHMVFAEKPEAVNQAIRKFLDRL